MQRGVRRVVLPCVCAWALLHGSARAQGASAQPPVADAAATQAVPSQPGRPDGVPVMFRGQEVGRIYLPFGPFSAEDRARLAQERLAELAGDYSIGPEEISIVHLPTTSELQYGGRVIWVVTDQDAAVVGGDRRARSDVLLQRVRALIVATRQEFSRTEILRGVALVAILTGLLLVVIWGILRLSRVALRATESRVTRMFPWLHRFDLVPANAVAAALARLVRISRTLLIFLFVLSWLQAGFALLPWTRPYARLVVLWLADPLRLIWTSVVGFIPNVFYLLVIFAFTRLVLYVMQMATRLVETGRVQYAHFEPEWAQPTYKLLRVVVVALAVVAAFPYIPGSSSPAFQGISLFLGFFITLSSSSAISNIIAGVILTYTGAFRIGERVCIAETTGDVVKTSLLTTQLRTIKNVIVTIPNSQVLGGQIQNFSAMAAKQGLILHTTVTIGYDAPWPRVHELLISAARACDGVLQDPAPFVLQTALNDFYVSYQINAYISTADRMSAILSNLHVNIQDAFHRGGVEIMSPHYTSLRDGNRSTIGGANLGPDYQPPPFRIRQVQSTEDPEDGSVPRPSPSRT